ncbi:hypothetical protein [Maritimibacter alkaliphilus]|uniref:hypothetical protein n=1 Tax=Maritimibacter alkaliphilus TaxID=404236 RepID=UPI001C988674|nr:hypothetical protein [Maritimibacter alkaliphilus]MBY6090180.1 hypothetical protein [Maritimibacter alkaliphilus]
MTDTTHDPITHLSPGDRARLAAAFGPDPALWPAPWAQLAAGTDDPVLLAAISAELPLPSLTEEYRLAQATLARVRQDRRRHGALGAPLRDLRLPDWRLPVPTPAMAGTVLALALVATPMLIAKYPSPARGRDMAMAGLALGDPLGFDPVLSFVLRLGAPPPAAKLPPKLPAPARRALP